MNIHFGLLSPAIQIRFSCLLMTAIVCCTPCIASPVWDEGTDGSLSTDRFTPTNLGILSVGDNHLSGTTVSGISKFFTLTINDGHTFEKLWVDSWESEDDLGFLGIVTGNTFSVDPASPDVTQLLGYTHYGAAHVNQDILPAKGSGPGSQGFTAPLGPGDYSFWVRQGGADPASWTFNFEVSASVSDDNGGGSGEEAIPEPTTLLIWCVLGGLGLLVCRRRSDR